MPFIIDAYQGADYISVRHHGDCSVSEIDDVRESVRRAVAESGIRRILVDIREASSFPSGAELFFVVDQAAQRNLGSRTAIVVGARHRKAIDFLSLMGGNRGIEIQAFERPIEAIAWLKSG